MKYRIITSLLAACLVMSAQRVAAAPITYEFTLGGFDAGGTVSGTFTGEDLNGDGYLSSFIFSQDIDFNNNPFEAGLNEVTFASITFNGELDADEFGSDGDNVDVTTFTLEHDLTDTTDRAFDPQFGPFNDLFFVMNFNLQNGGLLGDDQYEGILLAPFTQSYVFGLGAFLPSPQDSGFTDSIPAGSTSFSFDNELDGGASLTSGILLNQSSGAPCTLDMACGVVHSVFLDNTFTPNIGGFDTSSEFLRVTAVPEPLTMPLMIGGLAALCVIRLRNKAMA